MKLATLFVWIVGTVLALALSYGCQPVTAPPPPTPVSHPIQNLNQVTVKAQQSLGKTAIVGGIVFAVGVGLLFTSLSTVSKILVPVGGAVCGLSYLGIIALPIFPWVVGGAAVLAVGLFAYEVYRAKSLKGGIEDLETDIGLSAGTKAAPVEVKLVHG